MKEKLTNEEIKAEMSAEIRQKLNGYLEGKLPFVKIVFNEGLKDQYELYLHAQEARLIQLLLDIS